MPTPVTGTVSYNTPSTFTSLEALTATEWNKVANDVGYLRAKPYALVWQTAAPSPFSSTNPVSSTDLSSGNYKTLFSTGNGGGVGTSISTSGVGAVTLATDGRIITPSGVAGIWHAECRMMGQSTASTGHIRVSALLYDAAANVVSAIPGTWVTTDSGYNVVSSCSFSIPFNVSGSAWGNVSAVKFVYQWHGVFVPFVTNDVNGNGPGSTPKQFNTYASLEYLGTSTGSY